MHYVVYEGDEVVAVGTKHECAEILGVKPDTVVHYTRPSAARRSRTVVKVRDEDVESQRHPSRRVP